MNLEIFHIVEYSIVRSATNILLSKELDILTFTNSSKKHFLAYILVETRRKVTI